VLYVKPPDTVTRENATTCYKKKYHRVLHLKLQQFVILELYLKKPNCVSRKTAKLSYDLKSQHEFHVKFPPRTIRNIATCITGEITYFCYM